MILKAEVVEQRFVLYDPPAHYDYGLLTPQGLNQGFSPSKLNPFDTIRLTQTYGLNAW